jgi:hypothetical protein
MTPKPLLSHAISALHDSILNSIFTTGLPGWMTGSLNPSLLKHFDAFISANEPPKSVLSIWPTCEQSTMMLSSALVIVAKYRLNAGM